MQPTLPEEPLFSVKQRLGLAPPRVIVRAPPILSVSVNRSRLQRGKSIADTIDSIRAQTYPVADIIVVDDCSSDRTGEIARSMGVTVCRTHVNQGTKAQAQKLCDGSDRDRNLRHH